MVSLSDLLSLFEERKLLKKYNLKKVGIFGSILHSDEPNDIDLLIEEYDDYKALLALREELENATGKSVDVVVEPFASPIISYRAKKDIHYVA